MPRHCRERVAQRADDGHVEHLLGDRRRVVGAGLDGGEGDEVETVEGIRRVRAGWLGRHDWRHGWGES